MNEQIKNLNELKLFYDDGSESVSLQDYSVISNDESIEVVFRNLENRLIEEIDKADFVLGCVAWLTSNAILNALAKKKGVFIVVQKEDFLRPDLGSNFSNDWAKKLRSSYNRIRGIEGHYFEGTFLRHILNNKCINFESIRCVGNHNSDEKKASPRCHHKFAVFARHKCFKDFDGESLVEYDYLIPEVVWTGSFNFTKNAGCSLENAIILQKEEIVKAYFNEFCQIASVSEFLDWSQEWATPQYFIGS